MIKNERQLAISRKKRDELLASANEVDAGSNRAVYEDLASEVEAEIRDYLSVREGHVNVFRLESLDDLPDILIKARIARRWTQQQLADALGVTEQQVQKDEAGGYESARFARLADVLDILRFGVRGEVGPNDCDPEGWRRAAGSENRSTSITVSFDSLVQRAVAQPIIQDVALNTLASSFLGVIPALSGLASISPAMLGLEGRSNEFKVLEPRPIYATSESTNRTESAL